jgi:23S rRNA pseudouridine2605 synthase
VTVTRLFRISFGDYQLQTIPPGMAIEVPIKDLDKQLHKGPLFSRQKNKTKKTQTAADKEEDTDRASPIQWVRHYR